MSDKAPRAEAGEFKGYPTITVYTGHEYQGKEEYITMGLRKAQAVDDCIDTIRAWIDEQKGHTRKGQPTGKKPEDDNIPF
jgi:hypothetical protein